MHQLGACEAAGLAWWVWWPELRVVGWQGVDVHGLGQGSELQVHDKLLQVQCLLQV
jgi:hypothetical protein